LEFEVWNFHCFAVVISPEGVNKNIYVNQILLESRTKEGNSPVDENKYMLLVSGLKYGGGRQSRWKPAGLLLPRLNTLDDR